MAGRNALLVAAGLIAGVLSGCGAAPIFERAPIAPSLVSGAAHNADLALDLKANPAFAHYNETLNQTALKHTGSTLIAGGMLTPYNREALQSLNATYYGPVFQDAGLMKRTQAFTEWWANSNSTVNQVMREAYVRVLEDQPCPPDQPSYIQEILTEIHSTRAARWKRLAQRIGISVPSAFHVYRGVKGDLFVESVVNAWRDENKHVIDMPIYTLSSWSMNREMPSMWYQLLAPHGEAERLPFVVFEAVVPFERTVMDKWVDGGEFVIRYPGQDEVVVALAQNNDLAVPERGATVRYQGQAYDFSRREALIRAWDASHSRPTAGSL